MITIEDCIGLCGLTREEVEAIAEHEHIPEAAATAMGTYLVHLQQGPEIIRDMIRDDIRLAMEHGHRQHAANLLGTLRAFVAMHPLDEPPDPADRPTPARST